MPPSPPFQIERHTHPDALPEAARRLLAQAESETGYLELGLDWWRNLVDQVYAGEPGLAFYLLRQGEQVLAILPMRCATSGWQGQHSSLSNYYSAIYAPILHADAGAAELAQLLRALRREHGGASLRFAPMDPQSRSYAALLQALRLAGLRPFEYFCFGNWFRASSGSWDEYLQQRPGPVRSTIKRAGKKFSAAGGTLELVTGGAQLEQKLAAYTQVYGASWKVPEPYPGFVPGLARYCAERGWLRLGIAWLNGQPVAAQLWIVAHGRANIYKLAYDEAYKAYASGTLLTAMLMQHVLEQDGVREVDYLIGDDPYKKAWMDQRRERWGIVAYNPASPAGLLGLLRERAGRALRRLRPLKPQPDAAAPQD